MKEGFGRSRFLRAPTDPCYFEAASWEMNWRRRGGLSPDGGSSGWSLEPFCRGTSYVQRAFDKEFTRIKSLRT